MNINQKKQCGCNGLSQVNGLQEELSAAFSGISADAAAAAFGTPQAQAAVAAIVQSSMMAASSTAKAEVVKLLIPAVVIGGILGWLARGKRAHA